MKKKNKRRLTKLLIVRWTTYYYAIHYTMAVTSLTKNIKILLIIICFFCRLWAIFIHYSLWLTAIISGWSALHVNTFRNNTGIINS